MRKSRFNEQQMVKILREADSAPADANTFPSSECATP